MSAYIIVKPLVAAPAKFILECLLASHRHKAYRLLLKACLLSSKMYMLLLKAGLL